MAYPERELSGTTTAEIYCLEWSPDGRRVAYSAGDKTVRIWDPETGTVTKSYEVAGAAMDVRAVRWSPDGTQLAIASRDSVKVLDPETGAVTTSIVTLMGQMSCLVWSPDGTRLAAPGFDKSVRIWDAASGTEKHKLVGHTHDLIYGVAWSPDGTRLASGGEDKTIRLWDPATGDLVKTLTSDASVGRMAWSTNGMLLAVATGKKAVVWDPSAASIVRSFEGHTDGVHDVAWSPDGRRLASAGRCKPVRIWDYASGALSRTLIGHTDTVNSVEWSPDGTRLASASKDSTLRVWDPDTMVFDATSYPSDVQWSPDGTEVAIARYTGVSVWSPGSATARVTLERHGVRSVSWSPDGKSLALGGDKNEVCTWDLAASAATVVHSHTDDVTRVVWSPDGTLLASSSWDGTIRVWNSATKQVVTFLGTGLWTTDVQWSPDGSLLAVGYHGDKIKIFDYATQVEKHVLEPGLYSRESIRLVWDPTGKRLAATGTDNSVQIWNTETGTSERRLSGHSDDVNALAWSADGRRLASGADDNTVRIWEPHAAICERTIHAHTKPVTCLDWSPDGTELASGGGNDYSVRVTPIDRVAPTLAAHLNGIDAGFSATHGDLAGQFEPQNGFTMEAWVRPTAVSGRRTILSRTGVRSGEGIWLGLDGGKLTANLQVGDVTLTTARAMPSDGAWHHIATSWSRQHGALTLSLDGNAGSTTATITDTLPQPPSTSQFRIGHDESGSNRFAGDISTVRLWNGERTAAELAEARFRSDVGVGDNQFACGWRLSGSSSPVFAGYGPTLTHSQVAWHVADGLEVFDRDDQGELWLEAPQGADLKTSPNLDDAFTIELWVRPEHDGLVLDGPGYSLSVTGTTARWSFTSSGSSPVSLTLDVPIPRGRGVSTHLAATWSKTAATARGWVNGVERKSAPFAAATLGGSKNQHVRLGGGTYSGGTSQLAMWERDLGARELEGRLAARLSGNEDGLVAYWPLSRPSIDGLAVRQKAGSVSAGRLGDGELVGGPRYRIGSGPALAAPRVADAVLFFDRASTMIPDQSPSGHHAVRHGGSWDWHGVQVAGTPSPRGHLSLACDGHTGAHADYIDVGPGVAVGDAITVEAWVRFPDIARGGGTIISSGTGGDLAFCLEVIDAQLKMRVSDGTSDGVAAVAFAHDKNWHHVSAAWSAASKKLRVTLDDTTTTVDFAGDFVNGGHITIGRSNNGWVSGAPLTGSLADVRLWSIERSAADTAADRARSLAGNEAGLIGYWTLNGVNEVAVAPVGSRVRGAAPAATVPAAVTPGAITVEVWVRPDGLERANACIYRSGHGPDAIRLFAESSSTYAAELAGHRVELGLIDASAWSHLAVTYDGSSLRGYLDGRLESTVDAPGLQPSISSHVLGGAGDGRVSWRGAMADVRVWSVARTTIQLDRSRNRRLSGGEVGLQAYFPLDRGTGRFVIDLAGGHRAELIGPSWKSDATFRLGAATSTARTPVAFKGATRGALSLGASSKIDCGELGFGQGHAGYTVEIWFRCDRSAQFGLVRTQPVESGAAASDSSASDNTPTPGISLVVGTDGTLAFQQGSFAALTSATRVDDGAWHHVAAVGGPSPHLYLDGVKVATTRQGWPALKQQQWLTVGQSSQPASDGGNRSVRGLRIWDVALGRQDIHVLHKSAVIGTPVGLTAYWPFDGRDDLVTGAADIAAHRVAHFHDVAWSESKAHPPPRLHTAQTAKAKRRPRPGITNPANALHAIGAPPAAVDAGGTPATSTSGVKRSDLPQWLQTLLGTIDANLNGGSLTIDNTTFEDFKLFGLVPDVFFSTLTITNVSTELICSVEDPVDPASATFGLTLSGDAAVLGLPSATVTIEFSTNPQHEHTAVVKVMATGDATVGTLLGTSDATLQTLLDVIGASQLRGPALAFATEAVSEDEDEPFDAGIGAGLNLYGTLDLSGARPPATANTNVSLSAVLAFIGGLLDIESITCRLNLNKTATAFSLELSASVESDIDIVSSDTLTITYTGSEITVSVTSGELPSLELSSGVELTMDFLGADALALTGAITGDATSFGAAYSLVAEDGPWHPFNLSAISVEALALEIGGTWIKPYINNIAGAAKKLTVGSKTGTLAMAVEPKNPSNFGLLFEMNEITVIDAVAAVSPAVFVAWQALPAAVTDPIDSVVNLSLRDAHLSMVPESPLEIGELLFDDEGITCRGTTSLWGWDAKARLAMAPGAVDVGIEIDPVRIAPAGTTVFSLDGATDGAKPQLALRLGAFEVPDFSIDAAVTLLGVRTEVAARLEAGGIAFSFEHALPVGHVSVAATVNDTTLQVGGDLDAMLSLRAPVPLLGTVQFVKARLHASVALSVAPEFSIEVDGAVELNGIKVDVKTQSSTPIGDFESLVELILDHLEREAATLFGSAWATLEDWAEAVAQQVLLYPAGAAEVAKEIFDLGAGELARIAAAARTVGESAESLAVGMKKHLGAADDAIVKALGAMEHYGPVPIAKGLVAATPTITGDALAVALKAGSFGTSQVASGLSAALSVTHQNIADSLKAAGYAKEAVAAGLAEAFDLADSTAKTLAGVSHSVVIGKALGSGVTGTGGVLISGGQDALNKGADIASGVASGGGNVAKDVWNWTKDRGGDVKDLGKGLAITFGLMSRPKKTFPPQPKRVYRPDPRVEQDNQYYNGLPPRPAWQTPGSRQGSGR